MIHEPRGFLRHVKRAMNLIRANTVFAVGDHPDRGEPLIEADRRILKDRSDLGAELLFRVLRLAFPQPPRLEEGHFLASTRRALHALRPSDADHEIEAGIRVGEVADRIL